MNAHEKERNEMLSKIDEEKIKALKEQPAREGEEEEYEQIKQKVCSDCPSHKDDYCGYVTRQLQRKCNYLSDVMYGYELGRQSKPRIVFSKEVFDQYDREQFINAYKPKVSEGFEEEIDRLWNSFADEMEGPHNLFDVYARLARHFAQWQMGKDLSSINKSYESGVVFGMNAQKEQMLKEAVEGVVSARFGTISIPHNIYEKYDGEKVRIIIVKEEEK